MAPAIVVPGLVKNFGTTRALNGLDLKVETGEVYGFLGPNLLTELSDEATRGSRPH